MSQNDYSHYTILVVDDIPVNVLLVKSMLAKSKFRVISANSGRQALELLKTETPDCILMDILMPDMDGFETTRAVRSNEGTKDIPVIILSALNSDADIKKGHEAGANEFVTKPFSQERIVSCILSQITCKENGQRQRPDATAANNDFCNNIRLMSYIQGLPQGRFAQLLGELAVCMPPAMIKPDIFAMADHTEQGILTWVADSVRKLFVKNMEFNLSDIVTHITEVIQPAAQYAGVTWRVGIDNGISVLADGSLLTAVFTNLLSHTCRIAKGEVSVSGTHDGGLASIVIAMNTHDENTADTDFRVAVALELATKMNGAVICEREPGVCKFQILLPTI